MGLLVISQNMKNTGLDSLRVSRSAAHFTTKDFT
eukprot:SAG11_NODE_28196_length_324_cov_1.026667_1_plen_33_part_01